MNAVGMTIAAGSGNVGLVSIGPIDGRRTYRYLVMALFETGSSSGQCVIQASVAARSVALAPTADEVDGGRQLFQSPGGRVTHWINSSGGQPGLHYIPIDLGPDDVGKYVNVEVDPDNDLAAFDGWLTLD